MVTSDGTEFADWLGRTVVSAAGYVVWQRPRILRTVRSEVYLESLRIHQVVVTSCQ